MEVTSEPTSPSRADTGPGPLSNRRINCSGRRHFAIHRQTPRHCKRRNTDHRRTKGRAPTGPEGEEGAKALSER